MAQGELGRLEGVLGEIAVTLGIEVKGAVDDAEVIAGAKVEVIELVYRPVSVHVESVRQVRQAIHQPEAVQDAEVGAGISFRRREVHAQPVQVVDVAVVIDVDVEVIGAGRVGRFNRRVDVLRPVRRAIGEKDGEVRVSPSE